ncbi:hypothetical protein phiCPD_00047 [Clostridium phage phiCp-D]|nr:hypothetical protein phiCPD_00047 [Clostridium phage phiCp-D]
MKETIGKKIDKQEIFIKDNYNQDEFDSKLYEAINIIKDHIDKKNMD